MTRCLIVGFGSIAARHMQNLKALGISDIAVCDSDPQRCVEAKQHDGPRTFARLEEALQSHPDVVFVTTPPASHVSIARAAAEAGCHLFVEKPLSHTEDGLDELVELVRRKRLVTMVGCNMRFHDGPATIKRLLDERAIGSVISASLDAGMYLPDWHPDQDYRRAYSARRSLGGGVILDGIHEIDYARWLFGEVTEVFCQGGRLSHLEIETEDSANILMKMRAGFSVAIHIDYIQRAYGRSCKVIGEEGTIGWEIGSPLRWFSAATKSWHSVPSPDGYTINDMYLEELRHFLRCLERSAKSALDIEEGVRVTRLALAIKRSMDTGKNLAV